MIKKIVINGIASYKNSNATLETDRKVNLVYGLNGSGKTTISNYLQNLEGDEFSQCNIEGFNESNQKILIYNQKFVEANFYQSTTQKGIFTLAKENKEAIHNIETAKKNKKNLESELSNEESGYQKKFNNKELEINNNENQTINEIWKIKTKYTGGDRVFDKAGFLNGLKRDKKDLFDYIKKIPLEEEFKEIEIIKKELQELEEGSEKRSKINDIDLNRFLEVERNELFQKEIIGNQNSIVSELINNLNNSDWVKKGLEYIDLDKTKNCPFCQEKTLSNKLVNNIKDYFDETYSTNISDLENLKGTYQNLKSLEIQNYQKDFFSDDQKLQIEKLFNELTQTFDNNFKKIEDKIQHSSQKVELDSSKGSIDKANTFIGKRNEEIQRYNEKLDDRENVIEELKKEFWKNLRKEYNPKILDYKSKKGELEKEKEGINKSIEEAKKEKNKQEEIIIENQKKITNMEQTIEAINTHLLDFGIQDFKIVKFNNTSYKIKREYEEEEGIFKSLSEGEKTVISFLYFVELCKGKENQMDNKEKIVIVDDPISSLSHVYVFNVAVLIKNIFTKKNQKEFMQCFVLTHSLYFFNELIDRKSFENKDKECYQKLFRISKNEHGSEIKEMKHNEIQNEYQSYWSVFKDGDNSQMPIVANAMRNIIEYFFSFIDTTDNINNIFQKKEFSDNKYQAFKRYIDRESHSDPINISDYKEFDYDFFKNAFNKIFELSGYENHYNKMMK